MYTINNINPQKGQRILYSAGFNVPVNLSDTTRLDEEVDDLKFLSSSGCRTALISHQGFNAHEDSIDLDYVIPYLKTKLHNNIRYFKPTTFTEAYLESKKIHNGEIVIFGNTRFYDGEQKNDTELARHFAKLGDMAVIGGFSKFHREHASNCGILNFISGALSSGVLKEINKLKPWSSKSNNLLSLAILGGTKIEKIETGLVGFLDFYDYVIPGGTVLNAILKWQGYQIGASLIPKNWKKIQGVLDQTLSQKCFSKLLMPEEFIVFDDHSKNHKIVNQSELLLSNNQRIVDYHISSNMRMIFDRICEQGGRAILAGTPSIYKEGWTKSSNDILNFMENDNVNSIILGGDSAAELPFNGNKSSGGGSALAFIVNNTSPVIKAMNKKQEPQI